MLFLKRGTVHWLELSFQLFSASLPCPLGKQQRSLKRPQLSRAPWRALCLRLVAGSTRPWALTLSVWIPSRPLFPRILPHVPSALVTLSSVLLFFQSGDAGMSRQDSGLPLQVQLPCLEGWRWSSGKKKKKRKRKRKEKAIKNRKGTNLFSFQASTSFTVFVSESSPLPPIVVKYILASLSCFSLKHWAGMD